MHYGQIMIADSANGAGIRLTLFVSGCTNHCPGCFQPETWDFSFGEPYTQEVEDKILDELQKPYYDGLTILGGEPFEIENQPALLPLIKRVHEMNPKRTIWMYTGFHYEDLLPGGKRYTPFTGLDEPVIKFLEDDGEITTFLEHAYALVDASVKRYMERGFTNLSVCFGCTGG